MPKASEFVLGTERELLAAKPQGARTDFRIKGAPGLQLRVSASGAKSWAVAYLSPVTGKWAKYGLGTYPSIGLAEARGTAGDVLASVRKGRDPVKERKQLAPVGTFKELADLYLAEHEQRNAIRGRPSPTTLQARRILQKDILPSLGSSKPEEITRLHVAGVVAKVTARGKLVAADRVLATVRAVYNWGCGAGRIECNPTLGLKKRNAARAKDRVLAAAEIRTFWHFIEDAPGLTAKLRDGLRLQLLTGQRIGEILEAPRSEFDLDASLWTITADRTKARREQALPLSPEAVALVRSIVVREDEAEARRALREHRSIIPSVWLYPSERAARSVVRGSPRKHAPRTDGAIDPHASTRALVRLRADFVAAGIAAPFNTHDLRRTVATEMGEMGIAEEVIARVLNHAPRTVTGRHYNHARQEATVRAALDGWAKRLMAMVA